MVRWVGMRSGRYSGVVRSGTSGGCNIRGMIRGFRSCEDWGEGREWKRAGGAARIEVSGSEHGATFCVRLLVLVPLLFGRVSTLSESCIGRSRLRWLN